MVTARSYPDLKREVTKKLQKSKSFRKKYGSSSGKFSKKKTLAVAREMGISYNPPARFGTKQKVTAYETTGKQIVREEGKIVATLETPEKGFEQRQAEAKFQRQKQQAISIAQEQIKKDIEFKTGVKYTESPQQLRFYTKPVRPTPTITKVSDPITGVQKPTLTYQYSPQQFTSTLRAEEKIKLFGRPKPKTLREKIDISLEKGESFKTFFEREGAPVLKTSPLKQRLSATTENVFQATSFGFGTVYKTAKEKPIQTGLTLGTLAIAGPVAARGVSFTTGLALSTSKSIVGLGLLGGFATYKEIKEPGAITTVGGAIATGTEFGTFALGTKVIGATIKAARFTSPRFIPFRRTAQTQKLLKPTTKEIQIFEGTTRLGTAFQQSIKIPKGKTILYSSTITTPKQFFGTARGIRKTVSRLPGAQKLEPKFKVEAPPKGSVGGERAKFKEEFFFVSKGEAFTMFGESGAQRLGAGITRSPTTRFSELFLRTETPTLLRFQEKITPFPKSIQSKITSGKFGVGLRREVGSFISSQPNKIFPGPRTTGIGFGEQEFVIAQKTPIYYKSGKKTTYDPFSQRFQKVIDVGLKPGRQKTSFEYNLPQRLSNIGEIYSREVFGVKPSTTKLKSSPQSTELFRPLFRSSNIKTRLVSRDILPRSLRSITRTRDVVPRTRTRSILFREPKTRQRTRDVVPRTRTRSILFREPKTRQRTREIVPRVRTSTTRLRVDTFRLPSTRIRMRGRKVTRPPPPQIIIQPPPTINFPKIKPYKSKDDFKIGKSGRESIYTASLVAQTFNIRAPKGFKKGKLSGLELRPLLNK